MKLKVLFQETRPHFLILSIVLAFLGTAIAWFYGFLHVGYAFLAGFGLVLAHTSVNTLNDYFDYKSGIDLATARTPFSGGSGILPAGLLKPGEVLVLGIGSFLVAAAIGIFFIIIKGWLLIPLLLVGGFCILLYTPLILKKPWPEWSPGVGLGILPVLGMYFVQTGAYTWPVLIASVPSGILVHNLLFLNEFPDTEADSKGKRKTMPVTLGKRKSAAIYTTLTLLVYVWIIAWVLAGFMPLFSLLALLTLPFAIKAIRCAWQYEDRAKFIPGMAQNVLVVLLTQFLLGAGYLVSKFYGA